jgi:hypothetical protein
VKEWNLEKFVLGYFWKPLDVVARGSRILTRKRLLWAVFPLYGLGLSLAFTQDALGTVWQEGAAITSASLGLVLVFRAFTERRDVKLSWVLLLLNHFWILLSIQFGTSVPWVHSALYLGGIVSAGTLGYCLLRYLEKKEKHIALHRYHGHAYEHPRLALVFLLCGLTVSGFPISTTFIGEDLVFTHIGSHQYVLAILVATGFIVDGLAMIRLYARIFLGPHVKSYHAMAYKSS